MVNNIYMNNDQVDALRTLNETLMVIKSVRKEFEAEQNPNAKREIMGRLLSLYASIQEKETAVVAYITAFSKKESA